MEDQNVLLLWVTINKKKPNTHKWLTHAMHEAERSNIKDPPAASFIQGHINGDGEHVIVTVYTIRQQTPLQY
jgi:hypothetical protein